MTENDLIGALNRRSSKVHVGKVKVARKLLKTRATSFAQLPSAHDTMTPHQIMMFETNGMLKAETEQRARKDTFWGFDKQASDCRRERKALAAEDKRSMKHEMYCAYVKKLAGWREQEVLEQMILAQQKEYAAEEKRMSYMDYFMTAESTNDVINYSWSGLRISDNNIDDEPFYSNSMFQANVHLFDLDMENYAVSPGRATTMHVNGKLQTRIVAPNIKMESTISPHKSSAGSVSESVYLQPGTWVKRTHDQRTESKAAARGAGRGKERLLERSQKVRNMPQLLSEPKHTDELDGHPVHKWDQRHILRVVFTIMDKNGEGSIIRSTLSVIEKDFKIHALLRFTIFGAWTKQRKWSEFFRIFDEITSSKAQRGTSGEAQPENSQPRMTVNQWVSAARDFASVEENVPVSRIRSDEEHRILSQVRAQEDWAMLLDNDGSSNQAWFAENFRRRISIPLREAKMKRTLTQGDSVWGLHHHGCFWLPAVIEHAAPDGSWYTLRYPLTTSELQAARMTSSSKQFLYDQKNGLSVGKVDSPKEIIRLKPFVTEMETCGYVFDCIDSRNAGSVDARALVEVLKSNKYDRVVSTSYCLSQVVVPFISDELLKVVEDKAKAEKRSPSMMILKADFLNFCLALEELSQLHDRTYIFGRDEEARGEE